MSDQLVTFSQTMISNFLPILLEMLPKQSHCPNIQSPESILLVKRKKRYFRAEIFPNLSRYIKFFQGKKVKLYFRMDGSGLFSLSACEQIEKFEEWVEVPVSKIL